MKDNKYPSFEEYYDDIARQAVEKCTFCGECVENCLSYPLSPLKDKDGCQVMQNVIEFLEDGTYSDDVYLRAFTCAQCGNCSDLCPQGIDPFLLMETTIVKLVQQGKQPPEAVNFVIPERKPNLVGVLSALQTKPSEARWLKRAPEHARKVENVVFLGCEPQMMPHKIFASLDVFEAMGLDFVTLSGGELCCGVPHALAAGNPVDSEKKARELVDNIKAFSPKRVILVCPGCYRQFMEFFPRFLDVDFEVKFFTDLINENLDKINDTTQYLSKTIDDFRNFFNSNKIKKEFSIKEAFVNCFNLINVQFKNHNIQIIKNIGNHTVYGIQTELVQVLINILNNSRDELIKLDSQEKLIFIDTKTKDNQVIITIKDNAGGIDEKILEHLFEPYFTTKHQAQGTGIGLYMSEEIITKHMNGTISIENTTFVYNKTSYKGALTTIKLKLFR